ncbi:MAG: hypothetical protein IJN00_04150, partial [Clostridia bacterium]|nr:hypothetical protein [Clostridia bacterium]
HAGSNPIGILIPGTVTCALLSLLLPPYRRSCCEGGPWAVFGMKKDRMQVEPHPVFYVFLTA